MSQEWYRYLTAAALGAAGTAAVLVAGSSALGETWQLPSLPEGRREWLAAGIVATHALVGISWALSDWFEGGGGALPADNGEPLSAKSLPQHGPSSAASPGDPEAVIRSPEWPSRTMERLACQTERAGRQFRWSAQLGRMWSMVPPKEPPDMGIDCFVLASIASATPPRGVVVDGGVLLRSSPFSSPPSDMEEGFDQPVVVEASPPAMRVVRRLSSALPPPLRQSLDEEGLLSAGAARVIEANARPLVALFRLARTEAGDGVSSSTPELVHLARRANKRLSLPTLAAAVRGFQSRVPPAIVAESARVGLGDVDTSSLSRIWVLFRRLELAPTLVSEEQLGDMLQAVQTTLHPRLRGAPRGAVLREPVSLWGFLLLLVRTATLVQPGHSLLAPVAIGRGGVVAENPLGRLQSNRELGGVKGASSDADPTTIAEEAQAVLPEAVALLGLLSWINSLPSSTVVLPRFAITL
jgi:hypothetical protein